MACLQTIVGPIDRFLRRRCDTDPAGRQRPGRARAFETLEDRVVPATITVTNLGDSGVGTLRAAIEQANLDTARDTIDFAPSVTGTIRLSSALPDLSTDMILNGPGASVLTVARGGAAGLPEFRIFTVPAGAEVAISGLTIAGGRGGISAIGPGTLGLGGGIDNAGTLTVSNSAISGNSASNFGGGINNLGTLTVSSSTISGNSAGFGGGIDNGGALTVENSTINGNSALSGGGGIGDGEILTWTNPTTRSTVTVENSTISGNSAVYSVGGIESFLGDLGDTLTLTNCTISGNSGINGGIGSITPVTITNCTISGNSGVATGGISCGGITPVAITNCTISGNSGNVGGIFFSGARLTMTNSLISGNSGSGLALGSSGAVLLSHDLFSDAPGVALDSTNLINTDPLLGPLADNGGPTLTMALLPGSPAIDAGAPVAGVTTDQRGVPRPQGSAPDIGAFEFQGPFQRPRVVSLHRFGFHRLPTTLALTFSEPLDVTGAGDGANYQLTWAGPDHRLGTRDDRAIPIRFIRYHPGTDIVRLRPVRRLPLRQRFWLTVVGTPPGGLKDTTGYYLGSDYVAAITRKSLVLPHARGGHERAGR